jgi:L-lactate utilization protein LutB
MEAKKENNFVPVYFSGKRYDVPDSLTVMQAFEFIGNRFTRGCGCRGGVCGACAAVYVHPGSHKLEVGLACQIQVIPEMNIIQLPYFPIEKSHYCLDDLTPDIDSVGNIFPKAYKCVACNTCTKMCPLDIKVMDCMSAVLRGDIETVAKESMDCVMCGLCSSRCPVEIPQYHIMLLCRRLYGRYVQKPYRNLPKRLKQIEAGTYGGEIKKLMDMGIDQLKELYKKQQDDKQII